MDSNSPAFDISDIIGIEYDGKEIKHFKNIKEKLFGTTIKQISIDSNGIALKKIRYSEKNTDPNVTTSVEDLTSGRKILGSYCDFCDFRPKLRKPWILEAHMKTHTGDKPFPCSVCDFSTASKHYLEVHMRQHTGERPFECHECHLRFSRKDSLRRHYSTHAKEKLYSCTECNFKCARKPGLYQHWRFHCKYMHFKCSVCDYKCRTAVDLKNHILKHPQIYSCSKCDYIGRCVEDLEKHNCIPVTTSIKIFSCAHCGKSFTRRDGLGQHMRKYCKQINN